MVLKPQRLEEDLAMLLSKPRQSMSDEIWIIDVNEHAAQLFRDQLVMKARETSEPIIIYIDSYGGNIDAMSKMMETMDEVPNIKITVCMGKAMSAGAILLSHGDVRYCGQHSRIMIHEALGMAAGTVSQVNVTTDELNRVNRYFTGILAKNCGLPGYEALKKLMDERGGGDWYMTPAEAQKFNLVDHVGVPMLMHNVSSGFSTHLKEVKPRKKRAAKPITKKQVEDLMRRMGVDMDESAPSEKKRTLKNDKKVLDEPKDQKGSKGKASQGRRDSSDEG